MFFSIEWNVYDHTLSPRHVATVTLSLKRDDLFKASAWNLREWHVANRWIDSQSFLSRCDWMRSNRKSFLSIWHCRSLGMSCRLGCADVVLCLWEDVLNLLNGGHVEPKHKQQFPPGKWHGTWRGEESKLGGFILDFQGTEFWNSCWKIIQTRTKNQRKNWRAKA